MFDQSGQKIEVGQIVAVSVETGLRVGKVVAVIGDSFSLELDKASLHDTHKPRRRYHRPKRVRIIQEALPVAPPDKLETTTPEVK